MRVEDLSLECRLEQLAEECCEFGQAALKLARVLRKENPTPKTEADAVYNLIEECADVRVCINALGDLIPSTSGLEETKRKRWEARLND